MTIQHLFKNFLEDKQVYQNNVVYWKNILGNIVKDKSENYYWIEPKFANGESFFDGNPIISFVCQLSKKAVRIIQENPESDSIEIGAWVDIFYLSEDEPIKELVISLELSSESEKSAKNLIKKWIIEDLNNLQMCEFINKQIYPSNESVSMLVK